MIEPRSSSECPAFPPTPGTPIVFAARRRSDARRRGVRESGQGPDDPDGRSACWHHDDAIDCETLGHRLATDRETRRLTSIGVDLLLWSHAKRALSGIPQEDFLSRFEPDRRWSDGSSPPLGLARAAVLYHLPALATDRRTPAE